MLNPPILILSDESTEYSKKIVGAISVPIDIFYNLETWLNKFRIKNKLFAEIKWGKIKNNGKYVRSYLKMIEKTLSYTEVKFHSNCYKGDQYKASYVLVRSISWKLKHYGYLDQLGILFDEKDHKEVAKTSKLLNTDRNFYHKILFCTESDSKIFNIMQIVDLLCGCMAYKINYLSGEIKVVNKFKMNFIKEVEKIDNGFDLNLALSGMWQYNDTKKIQHFDLKPI